MKKSSPGTAAGEKNVQGTVYEKSMSSLVLQGQRMGRSQVPDLQGFFLHYDLDVYRTIGNGQIRLYLSEHLCQPMERRLGREASTGQEAS